MHTPTPTKNDLCRNTPATSQTCPSLTSSAAPAQHLYPIICLYLTSDIDVTHLEMPASRLHRLLELLLLLVMAATALAHPLCFSDATLNRLHDSINYQPVFQQILPWISCGYSPLVLKESLLLTLAIAALFVFTWIKVYEQWQTNSNLASPKPPPPKRLLHNPQLWLLAWIVYSGISVFWSPTFQQSLEVWITMTAGASITVMALALPSSRQFAVRFMALVVLCGVILAALALLQHLQKAPWLPASSDPRNRMSSLIGHNTGLSSWLMFPMSFAFYFGIVNRRISVRLFAWLSVIVFAIVIIAAQSRAIWLLALLIILFLPRRIMRITSHRLTLAKALLAVTASLLIIMMLAISPRTNPFARLPVSLSERLSGHVFNLDQLRRETRLRILVVSFSELIPKHPIVGTGLGSFEWVYPKAQGDYFLKHPNTRLGTTTKRTDLAHNDYLQVLVETGLIGALLLGGTMYLFIRQTISSLRQIRQPENRAAWWAFAVPVAAVMAHALVDFPMHVAPIAILNLLSAIQCRKVANWETPISIDAETAKGSLDLAPARPSILPAAASLAITTVVFAWTPWAFAALVGRPLVSDAYFNSGRATLERFYDSRGQTDAYKFTLLERSRRYFREAVVANVFNGEAYEGQATAYVNRATLALQHYELALEDNATTVTEMLRSQIHRDSHAAIAVINNQLTSGGLRYHFTYYLLGRAWRLLWEIEKHELRTEDSRAYREAVAAIRTAVEFNPADAVSLRELADILAQSHQTAAESHQTLDRLFKIDPFSARELIVLPAVQMAEEGDIHAAEASLQSLFANHPDEPATHAARAWVAFYKAVWPPRPLDVLDRNDEYLQWRRQHLDPARASIAALPDTLPYAEDKRRLKLLYAAASADINLAAELAENRLREQPDDPEAQVIKAWAHHERYGGGLPAQDSIDYNRLLAVYSVYFMNQRQQGLIWAGELYAKGGKLSVGQARRLASFCAANNWWSILRAALPGIRKDYLGDPMLESIASEMEAVDP